MPNQTLNISYGQSKVITVTGKDAQGNVKPVTNITITSISAPGALQVTPVAGSENQFTAVMPTNQSGPNQINFSAINELGNVITGQTPVVMNAVVPATTLETTYS